MASVHDGHRKRTREEFLIRPGSFPDHKLLELLLYYSNPRGDTNPLAHDLIDRFDSLAGVMDALPETLKQVPGVGEQTVVLLKLAKELSSRYFLSRTQWDKGPETWETLSDLFRPYFFGSRNERVCVLCMDGKGKRLGVRQLAEGSFSSVSVTARRVMEAALSLNAARVVLAHNHVSGLASPSQADCDATRYIWLTLRQVDVTLMDHLIFVEDDMVSLRESYPKLFQ